MIQLLRFSFWEASSVLYGGNIYLHDNFQGIVAAYFDMCLYHLAEFLATIHLKCRKPPAMQETQVQCLGREDPLEKEMETHPSNLAWAIPWTEESSGLQSMGSQELGTT